MFIGREKEQKAINEAIEDSKSKIIAIIGGRGIGKTSLMVNTKNENNDKGYLFIDLHGQKGVSSKKQQYNFLLALKKVFQFKHEENSWDALFILLEDEIIKFKGSPINKDKKIIFNIDEFPWLNTKRSNFVQAFSSFWNKIQHLENLYFILTGSAVAWMNRNVINNGGGLYGRVNLVINLKAFTFKETVDYLYTISKYSLDECLSYYMVTNGVARYLQRIKYQNDFKQNLLDIFKKNESFNEFDLLFTSSFESNLNIHKKIIELFKNKRFVTVEYIAKQLKISSAAVYLAIEDLLCSDMIIEHNNLVKQKGRQEKSYSLNNLFCFYHLKLDELQDNHREAILDGYAFEIFTRKNFELVREEMGREDVNFETFVFENNATQIDLISKESDSLYLLIECKNTKKEYEISQRYAQNIENKIEELSKELRKEKGKWSIKFVMFTPYGTKKSRTPFVNISLENIFNKYLKYRKN